MHLLISLFIISFFWLSAIVSPVFSQDLMSVYQKAAINDPQWRATRESIKARQEVLPQSRAALLPRLNLTATSSKVYERQSGRTLAAGEPLAGINETISDGDKDYNLVTYGARLEQPIFNLSSWHQYKRSKAEYSRLDAEFAALKQIFILRVSEAYIEVLRREEAFTFAKAEINAIDQQLKQTKARFNLGLDLVADVHDAQAAYDLAKVNLLTTQSEVAIALKGLEALTGERVPHILKLADNMPIQEPIPSQAAHWVTRVLSDNPALDAARLNKKSADAKRKQVHASYVPVVSAVLSYQHSDGGSFDSVSNPGLEGLPFPENDNISYGVQLSWTPFQGGAIRSNLRQASFEVSQAQNELEAEIRQLEKEAHSLFMIIQSDVLRVKARRQAITSSQSAHQATQAGYEQGTRNLIDVLRAQRNVFATQRDYAYARYDYLINQMKLKQLAGDLSEKDILSLNHWLE